jgi:hypothetical protein
MGHAPASLGHDKHLFQAASGSFHRNLLARFDPPPNQQAPGLRQSRIRESTCSKLISIISPLLIPHAASSLDTWYVDSPRLSTLSGEESSRMPLQSELWSKLSRVRSLQFVARSDSATGWNGAGSGTVEVSAPESIGFVFAESGIWHPAGLTARVIKFTNTFRWTMVDNRIRLEHLRFGADKPVFLFDLVRVHEETWRDSTPHQCSDDSYSALLTTRGDQLSVAWSIRGPRKCEQIDYIYW